MENVPASSAGADIWSAALDLATKSTVSLKHCNPSPFDGDNAAYGEATGVVVDVDKGIILTNRHVIGAGPSWGLCIFENREECDVKPIYQDPVHDFGFLKFNPGDIKYMHSKGLKGLKLDPSGAQVGVKIRIVGNDSGERSSILTGYINRLDRAAPPSSRYRDFNTNYIHAAVNTSGGSSGSPVINIAGHVIALHAGGIKHASTAFLLPLHRVKRALELLQNDQPISRGTIQTLWLKQSFDECRRKHLDTKWEGIIRKEMPGETSLLVAETVLPEGAADKKLQVGDILLKVEGNFITQFHHFEKILDSHVHQPIRLLIQRNGKDMELDCTVDDLHMITPDRFVNVAGGVFHNLSYQQASRWNIATRGLYVAYGGESFAFAGITRDCIIDSINHEPTGDLQIFIDVMKTIPDRSRVVISYRQLDNISKSCIAIVDLAYHWYPDMQLATRNNQTYLWDFQSTGIGQLSAKPQLPQKADFTQLEGFGSSIQRVMRSLVKVTCTMPRILDGCPGTRQAGLGVVIDAEQGFMVASRDIITHHLCDIRITIADSIIVDGKLIFMHPEQNYVIVQYNTDLVQTPMESAILDSERLAPGKKITFIGFNINSSPTVAESVVTNVDTIEMKMARTPRYQPMNFDAIQIDTSKGMECSSGILINEDGVVQALWMSHTSPDHSDCVYYFGLPSSLLLPVVTKIRQGKTPEVRILGMELLDIPMSEARTMGVTSKWIDRVAAENLSKHRLFRVVKTAVLTLSPVHENDALQAGDVILTLNGQLITQTSQLNDVCEKHVLDAHIVRKGQEMSLKICTFSSMGLETSHAVIFAGATFQRPHLAVRQTVSTLVSEIYVSAYECGSPAALFKLPPTTFITAVNGDAVHNLNDFKQAIAKIPNNEYFSLSTVNLDNIPKVVTLKTDEHYFPMSEYIKDSAAPSGWNVIVHRR